ncbi:MAG TPA: gfo/Idh/MocA family oxidoreductase, partial [Armatimonadota bacterium]|nr:gfo/Idh/MocA family oxidoreductase [Armatimonadota bacterium]
TQPGLFWYGIHTVEMLYATMGPGCERLTATRTEDHELVVGTWSDGRIGTVRGHRNASGSFGALIHRKKGLQFVDAYNHPRPAYAGLLERVLAMFRTGTSAIHPVETLEVIRFIEAANESRERGEMVELN